MQITKEMLGIETRKSILYLDQNFFSSVYRANDPRWATAMKRITELLDLQLLAVPYSSTHEAEAEFYRDRDGLVRFIQRLARGHAFYPYYRVEDTQIVKAFQAYLASAPASYVKEESDALPSSVHDWDGPYSVSVFCGASNVAHKRATKQHAVEELVKTLRIWAASRTSFEEDMAIEIRESGRILIESYATKAARLAAHNLLALVDSPISASVVEHMVFVLSVKKMLPDGLRVIPAFFQSRQFAEVPSIQLSARLFSTFKKRLRDGAFPNPLKAREKLSGFLTDVQHAATYAPYCNSFFTDRFMADLLNDPLVNVEGTFGCKVFSVANIKPFFRWLEDVKSRMTAEHADGLMWAYPEHRAKGVGRLTPTHAQQETIP